MSAIPFTASRPDSSRSGSAPMRTAAELLACSRACRVAAGAYAVELGALASRPGPPSAAATDLCVIAVQLQEASDELACAASDAEGLAIALHRAAGGDVILIPTARSVVVGQNADAPAASNDRFGQRVAVAARAILRFMRRA